MVSDAGKTRIFRELPLFRYLQPTILRAAAS